MAIPDRTTANSNWHYHVYDIPCGHAGAAHVGGAGACGPHVPRMQFSENHVNSWLPPAPAAAPAGPHPPPPHQARADGETRTREKAPLRGAGGNIYVHPVAVGDLTSNNRLSLRQDMADLQTAAGAGAPLYAVSGSIGTTYFGREIPYIMFGGNNNPAAPQVLLTGGVHAREWIAVEVPYLIAEYLIKNYLSPAARPPAPASQGLMSWVIDNCRICVIPMLNPDGHCWSVARANRLWRKNRRRWTKTRLIKVNPNLYTKAKLSRKLKYRSDQNRWVKPARETSDFQAREGDNRVYFGVDCNRNCWNHPRNPNPNPTQETYAGPVAFSESESVALRDFGDLPRLAASIDYHSAMGRVLYHEDAANAAGPLVAGERNAITHVAGCMQGHIAQYQQNAGAGNFHDAYPQATTISAETGGHYSSVGSIMDLCHRKIVSNNHIPLAYTIELDPIKTAPRVYNPACVNRTYRFFRIRPDSIQTVFEKNLTAALCLMCHAIQNLSIPAVALRGAHGITIAGMPCPFRPAGGGGGGGNDMVAKIVNRGNQPPNP